MKTETACIHAGGHPDPSTRGINTPIYTSSAFGYLDGEERPYPRYFNTPNQAAVVAKLCALEGAEDGLVLSSGMAGHLGQARHLHRPIPRCPQPAQATWLLPPRPQSRPVRAITTGMRPARQVPSRMAVPSPAI